MVLTKLQRFIQIAIFIQCSFLLFAGCKPAFKVQKTEQVEYVFSDSLNNEADSSVINYIAPFKEKMSLTMSDVLAESEFAMEKGNPESILGNFVADACMHESAKTFYPTDGRQADFAFFNNGGLRRSLPKGKITRMDAFELMPFENELVVLKINGDVVEKIFNFIASKDGGPISGACFRIKEKKAIDIVIQNNPLDITKSYRVLTSDYLANGGDSFDMITNANREYVNLKVRDAIIQYLEFFGKAGKLISNKTDGRISYAK